jgi:acyl carrier protein phosphodiesterase
MNYLGHLFLSGNEPLVIVGNFMADAVKGSDLSRFDPDLVCGIRLHRAIDSFTDDHPLQRAGRARLRPHAGRYSGVVMDLFYDHLLASTWSRWHTEPLPPRTQAMMPYMVQHDWLTSYARIGGLERALNGLARRVPAGEPMMGGETVLLRYFDDYLAEFEAFLPEIQRAVQDVR